MHFEAFFFIIPMAQIIEAVICFFYYNQSNVIIFIYLEKYYFHDACKWENYCGHTVGKH